MDAETNDDGWDHAWNQFFEEGLLEETPDNNNVLESNRDYILERNEIKFIQ